MSDVLGIDVSKWQGEMNWETAANAGAKFAIIRAGSITNSTGQTYEDTQFIRNSALAPQFFPYVSYYFYFRPQWGPKKQADFFTQLTDGSFRNLRLVADCEYDGGLSDYHCGESIQIFCERIRENVGQDPMMYTRSYWFNNETDERPLWPTLDLWIARYTTKAEPWGNPGDSPAIVPRDWDDWTFWQWSADSNGRGAEFGAESRSIDLDYFNGDEIALSAYSNQLFPGAHAEYIYVSRVGGALLKEQVDPRVWVTVLPYGHTMVVQGMYTDPEDNIDYYVVGDGIVRKSHCSPID
jgi:lysozyme